MEHDPLATPMRTPALRNLQLDIDGDVALQSAREAQRHQ